MGHLISALSMFCCKTYLDVEQKQNEENMIAPGPKIGFCPDWRSKKNGRQYYFQKIVKYYRELCRRHGANLIILGFEADPELWKNKLDGLIIPGGRDIDPRFYGQTNTNSNFNPVDAERRFTFCKRFVEECRPNMPIFGICYGFQVINCILGGNMVQKMHKSHYSKRTIRLGNGSFLTKALGKEITESTCYHHQCLDEVAPCLKATAWDATDNTVHAYEYEGPANRKIFGVLWHPESIYAGKDIDDHPIDGLKQYEFFFNEANIYMRSKAK